MHGPSGQQVIESGWCLAVKSQAQEAANKVSLPDRVRHLLNALQPAYWQALIVVSLLYFARFDASFITLRAKTVSNARQSGCGCPRWLLFMLLSSCSCPYLDASYCCLSSFCKAGSWSFHAFILNDAFVCKRCPVSPPAPQASCYHRADHMAPPMFAKSVLLPVPSCSTRAHCRMSSRAMCTSHAC